MPVIASSETRDQTVGNNVHFVSWTPLLNGDSGAPYAMTGFADRSVQIGGTFGTGGTVLIEGSNDGTNYATLADPQGVALSKTSAALVEISQIVKFIRPRVSAGDGTTSITVTLLARSSSARA
jgi:hypothetical protein